MNEQQKQNLESLYSHIEKRLALIGKSSNDYLMIDFEETPDAYLMMQLVEILKFELAKNESLEAQLFASMKGINIAIKGLRTGVIALAAACERDANFKSSYTALSDCISTLHTKGYT